MKIDVEEGQSNIPFQWSALRRTTKLVVDEAETL